MTPPRPGTDGEVAATGVDRYLKLPIERIADFDAVSQEWQVSSSPGGRRLREAGTAIGPARVAVW